MFPKIIIFLIISLFFLNKSEAKAPKKIHPNAPSFPPTSPTDDTPTPEKYSPQYKKFLHECQKRIEDECTDEIARNLIKHENVSKSCCIQFVNMGPDCHKALIYAERHLAERKYRKKVVSESKDLYKKCEKVALQPKEYPRLPARKYRPDYEEFLQGCGKKITENCGEEVVYAILEKNTRVDKDCCKKLFYMGKECHEEFVGGLENVAGFNKKLRHEVKVNGKKVWKHCENVVGHK